MLLAPERIFKADAIAVEILKRCTGEATLCRDRRRPGQDLQGAPREVGSAGRREQAAQRAGRRRELLEIWICDGGRRRRCCTSRSVFWRSSTHRCPLGCPYCSNPLALETREDELDAATWIARVQAKPPRSACCMCISPAESPGARRDLVEIAASARAGGLYTNLITSGVGITTRTMRDLWEAGLDHVQVSIQDADAVVRRSHRRLSRRVSEKARARGGSGAARPAAHRQSRWCIAPTSGASARWSIWR